MSDNAEAIAESRPEMPICSNDRAADIWEPLFAIASVISPEWLEKITKSAITLINQQADDDDESVRTQLLRDMREIFKQTSDSLVPSSFLVEELKNIEGSPWGDWNYGRGFTVHALAGQLKYFKIYPHQTREGGGRARKYDYADFKDAFERYLPVHEVDGKTGFGLTNRKQPE